MPTQKRRVALSLHEREHAMLTRLAEHQELPIASAAVRIVRAYLATGQLDLPEPTDSPEPAAATAPSRPSAAPAEPGELREAPAWLPPIDGDYAAWARKRASGVEAMLERYPAELSDLDDGWAADAPVREQLWALSVWRDLLDTGAYEDPRMELAFASALGDFATYLRERPRTRLGRARR